LVEAALRFPLGRLRTLLVPRPHPLEAPMPMKGVHVETLLNPVSYTFAQLERAALVAHGLQRGKLLLLESPPHADCREWMDDAGVCALCCRRAL